MLILQAQARIRHTGAGILAQGKIPQIGSIIE
jgi:hypothetical protein